MDNGPFRMGNSASARGTGSRSVTPRVEAERVAPAEEAPRKAPVHRPVSDRHPATHEPSNKKKIVIIGAIVAAAIIVLLVVCGWLMTQKPNATVIDSGKYQAVFFTNGQVYFGKLQPVDSDYMKLTGVFYLQTNEAGADSTSKNPQKTADSTSNDVQLIKLGNEIHGPTDEMIVSKDQVLFFENLKGDGKVATSIDQYNKSHK